MARYAAFLRGVMPTNARMAELVEAFELAGFTEVRTVLGSGNVVFTSSLARPASLERRAEAAMKKRLSTPFPAIIRPLEVIREMLASDPYLGLRLPPGARRVVTFLRAPPDPVPALPIERDGARILRLSGAHAFSAYVRTPRGPVFMTLLEKTFGKDITTRTWETLAKVLAAGA
ncbi:MAG TPA: DUF1697 domain-containing protein [Anaeromyxobacter sp.]|nr:DUF1697 domain-containing protein [Anaeromyxobacter sp.]